jgi:hypothetical protein
MIMVFDEIGKGGEGNIFPISTACLPTFGCVCGTKNSFFEFLVGNLPVQPLTIACAATLTGCIDTCNFEIPWIPTWSELTSSLKDLGKITIMPFSHAG